MAGKGRSNSSQEDLTAVATIWSRPPSASMSMIDLPPDPLGSSIANMVPASSGRAS